MSPQSPQGPQRPPTSRDDVVALGALLPVKTVEGLRPDERARLDALVRDGLHHEVRREQRDVVRRERWRAALAPTAVLGSAAAVLALVVVAAGSPGPSPVDVARPVVASAEAVQVLDRAARDVAREDVALRPREDQFVYARSVGRGDTGTLGGPVELGDREVREVWLSQEPGPTRDQGLIRQYGQDWPIWGAAGSPAGPRRTTYAYLDSLPTDPDELLDEVASQLRPWDDARSQDQVLFDELLQIVDTEQVVPADLTATFYRALTRIPGVGIDPTTRDLLGRPAIGVTRTEGVFLTRDVLLLDPRTGELLGMDSYVRTRRGEALLGATAVLERGVADRMGDPPVESVPVGSPRPERAADPA